ncbi:hypothetical protein EGW08_010630, partial [Elysia chlorotica]
ILTYLNIINLPIYLLIPFLSGLASLDAKNSGKMGLRAIVYYFTTTFVAIILTLLCCNFIFQSLEHKTHLMRSRKASREEGGLILEIHPKSSMSLCVFVFRNIFPDNILQACFQHTKTVYVVKEQEEYILTKPNITNNGTDLSTTVTTTQRTITTTLNMTSNETITVINETIQWVRSYPMEDGMNVLGIITFCTAFGILISNMGSRAQIMLDFFTVLNEIIMKMVTLVMWYSPIGILFLITGKILELEDPAKVGAQLGMYMVTILLGLCIHTVILLPSIYFVLTRKNPFRIMWGVVQAWVTALGTASSTATLPVTFQCLEVFEFVLPIGATINMDGTALYEAVAPIFIAQMNGIELTFGKVVAISLTATCASIGAAAIPSAGLVTMVMVLTSVGLPADDISLILAVDWFLDRFRTSTNVLGDSFGAAVVEHLSKDELKHDQHDPIDDDFEMDMQGNGKRKSLTGGGREKDEMI